MVSELNYMSQVVVMLYEDPTKDPCSEERFHVELHFSPGVNCCVQKNLPPGPGFRPHSRNESAASKNAVKVFSQVVFYRRACFISQSSDTSATATPDDPKAQCSTRIEEEEERIEEEKPEIVETPSTSEISPTLSPKESYYRPYVKSSDPIPIG